MSNGTDNKIKRMNFFDGLFLTEEEFDLEQNYHMRMRRLHNASFHGFGIIEGLIVTVTGDRVVEVTNGAAIDRRNDGAAEKFGREIVLFHVDGKTVLSLDDCEEITPENETFENSIAQDYGNPVYLCLKLQERKDYKESSKGGDEEIHIWEKPKLFCKTTHDQSNYENNGANYVVLSKLVMSSGTIDHSDDSATVYAGFDGEVVKTKRLEVSEKATVNGPLTVTEDASVGGTLTVTGDLLVEGGDVKQHLKTEDDIITLNTGIDADNPAPSTVTSGIEIFRGSEAVGKLVWDEYSERWKAGIDGQLYDIVYGLNLTVDLATGDFGVGGNLTVNGQTTLAGTDITGDANITGNASVSAGLGIGGDLAVSGQTTLAGTDITGDANITGNASVSAGLGVGGDLAVSGQTTLAGTDITGDANITGNASVSAGLGVGGDLAVSGQTTLAGTDITGDANITGNASVSAGLGIGSDLAVSGQTTLAGTDITGDANITGNASVSAGLGVGGDLAVSGQTTLAGTDITGDANITGNASVSADLGVGGLATVGDLVVTGDLAVQGDMSSINTAKLEVEDNIITANKFTPSTNNNPNVLSGLEVFRGASGPNAQLLFDENDDQWKIGTTGNMTPLATADQLSSGVSKDINQPTHGFIVGDAIYFNSVTKTYEKAQSSNAETTGLFLVSAVAADGNSFTLVQAGYVDGLSGLTEGEYHFVSDVTPGALTPIDPSVTDPAKISNPIFFADSATSGYVLPFRPSTGGGGGTGGGLWIDDGGGNISYEGGKVGVGTNSPEWNFQVQGTVDPVVMAVTGIGAANPIIAGFKARGTLSAKSAVMTGDSLFNVASVGYDGTKWSPDGGSSIEMKATENWTGTAQGGKMDFYVTNNGANSKTHGMTINHDGKVGIGTDIPSQKLDVNGTVKATSFIGDGSQLTGVGGGSLWASNGTNVYYNNGNVGIGTLNPSLKLHVLGDMLIEDGAWPEVQFRQTGGRSWRAGHDGSNFHIRVWQGSSLGYQDRIVATYAGNVGIGTTTPSYTLHTNGTSYAVTRAGGGIDYAEYFESFNGKNIPAGTAVTFEKGKIRPAKKNEAPFGVISANPIIVGGVHPEWPQKYLRDEFGAQIMEKVKEEIMSPKKEKVKKERQKVKKKTAEEEVSRTEVVLKGKKYCQVEVKEKVKREVEEPVFEEVKLYDKSGKKEIGKHRVPVMETYTEEIDVFDDDGNPVMVGTGKFETKERPKLNPKYDPKKEYVPRDKRPEWNCVGLLGQLPLRKGQLVAPTWVKIKNVSKDVELWLVK